MDGQQADRRRRWVCHQEAVPRALPVAFLLRTRFLIWGKSPTCLLWPGRGEGGHRPALCKLWVLGSGGGWTDLLGPQGKWGQWRHAGLAAPSLEAPSPAARVQHRTVPVPVSPVRNILAPALCSRPHRVRLGVPSSERDDVIITDVQATAAPPPRCGRPL